MEAKDKARELVEKFSIIQEFGIANTEEELAEYFHKKAKQCALIAVDEMLKEYYRLSERGIYWQEVKQEIEKL